MTGLSSFRLSSANPASTLASLILNLLLSDRREVLT